MIRFSCLCGQRLKARVELVGSVLPCPRCEQRVLVPKATDPKDEPYKPEDEIPEALPVDEESKALQLAKWITDKGIDGVSPVLSSAACLADEYLKNVKFKNDDDRIDSLVNWETSKNFTTGFLTGLGGVVVMPVTLPAAFGASWILQTRMCAAIAKIRGHSIEDPLVRTFVVGCLLGDVLNNIGKIAGIQVGNWAARSLVAGIPGPLLRMINVQIGRQLLTKGTTGTLMKAVPVVGGVVGGTVDAYYCRVAGRVAKNWFKTEVKT